MRTKRILFYTLFLATLLGSALSAPAPVDISDLKSMLTDHQFEYLMIAPPMDRVFVQPCAGVLPVDLRSLPPVLRKGMEGEASYGDTTIFRIVAIEELTTRDTVFLSASGAELFRFKAPVNYDPYAWQADFFGENEWAVASEWELWFYDTARVGALFTLIDASEYDAYVLAEQQARQTVLPMSAMRSIGAASSLQLSISRTNGMAEVTAVWPAELTDTLEFYAIDDLSDWPWSLVKTNITTASGSVYSWTDTDSTNVITRFYIAGNADFDGDGDGLADARELYLHGTSPIDRDGDGDGLSDGFELANSLDPFSAIGDDGALGDADGDGYGNLEEEKRNTDPSALNANSLTGTVTTIRYYYDEDDRLTDCYTGTDAAERDTLTGAHNTRESVTAGEAQ